MRVFIDNNIWDYLYSNSIKLEEWFSEEKYSLYITTHGKYEVLQMEESNPELMDFAFQYLDNFVKVDAIFGYLSDKFPREYQRISGYGVGRYTTRAENEVRNRLKQKYDNSIKRKSWMILFKNEADIELASRAIENVVLTFENNSGPLIDVRNEGGKVVSLIKDESKAVDSDTYMNKVLNLIDGHQT